MAEVLFHARIPGRPRVKKNNTRQLVNKKTGRRWTAPSARYSNWASFAALFINRASPSKPIDIPVDLTIKAYFADHAHEQDITNSIQGIEDLLQECGVLQNDKLIYGLGSTRKIFDSTEAERVEITLTPHKFETESQEREFISYIEKTKRKKTNSGKL